MAKTRTEKTVVLGDDSLLQKASQAEVHKKNAESEYDSARLLLLEQAESQREGVDTLRLQGTTVTATVSFMDKVSLDATAPEFQTVENAVEKGLLEGVISKTTVARIAPSHLAVVMKILKDSGIVDLAQAVTVETAYTVSPEGLRQAEQMIVSSPERAELMGSLKSSVRRTSTSKVTFKANR